MLDKKQKGNGILKRLSKITHVFSKLSPDEQIDLIDWIRDVLAKKIQNSDKGQVEEIIKSFKIGDETVMTYAIERYLDEVEEKSKIDAKIDSIIGIIQKFNVSLTDAMDAVKLQDKYKIDVITLLNEQNILYIE